MGLICLDLDGTLVESALVEEDGKLQRPQDNVYTEPVLRSGVLEAIRMAASEGDRFAIVTNQGGVGWGYHTVAEVDRRIGHAVALTHFFYRRPFTVHVAFEHPRATVPLFKQTPDMRDRRKPAPTMILEAMDLHGVGQADTLMVGDLDSDAGAARAAGVDWVHEGDFFSH